MAQHHPQTEYVSCPHATQYLCINQAIRDPIFQCALTKKQFLECLYAFPTDNTENLEISSKAMDVSLFMKGHS